MGSLLRDVRYGYRTLLKNPGFTATAVFSLALGIGANTAIFGFIDTVLLRALPVQDPKQLVLFGAGSKRGASSGPASGPMQLFSWREYQDFRRTNKVFKDILAVDSSSNRVYASLTGDREGLLATLVSGNFFTVLGVKPAAGQVFDDGVDRAGRMSPLAVLSDAFWERRFERDPKVIGGSFRIGSREYTIIGVAAQGFSGTRMDESPDMWLPVTMKPEFPNGDSVNLDDPKSHFMNLIGRLQPGITMPQAGAGINVAYRQILSGMPDQRTASVELTPADKGLSRLRSRYEKPLIVLMAVVGLVLVIACANVANLLVALGSKRQREMAVRVAIGAARGRIIRQLLTEGVLLSSAAGFIGILFATAASKLLVHLISTGPEPLPVSFDPDLRVLAFTVAVSLATGVIFSLAPALRASRVDLNSSLKEGRGRPSLRKVTSGRVLVAGQVALSFTLLIVAGLLLHSFENLTAAGTGFDRQNVLLFKIDSESSGYAHDQSLANLYSRIEEGVSRLPGVASGAVSMLSFHEGHWGENFTSPGIDLRERAHVASLNFVTPGFFETFRIPLRAGRTLSSRDKPGTPLVAVVGETFAKTVFAGADAVGKTIVMGPFDEPHPYLIVGVVGDAKTNDVRDKDEDVAYLPLAQGPTYAGNIAVRVSGDPSRVAAEVRRAIHSIEPSLPIRWTTTLADEVSDSLVRERAIAQLSGFFAGLALLLSAIGLYGTISFAVARRTNEIGIRMALGAEHVSVLGMVMGDAMLLVGIGIAIGIPLSIGAGRVMQSLLYGLSSFDAISAAAAVASLSLVAALAGYLPARRAAAVDPMVALRYE